MKPEGSKSALHFAYRNQSFLLSDIFGVLAAYGLTIHGLNLTSICLIQNLNF
ncbi:hypothetical protein NIES806_15350 [Dolichospermum compactum NIES-806]|uniref:Uncharacterized protein n=1 Tax=Dolichospermum compactum NIES-806 TaxID=1973481 RepID=A0A1Z4V1L5_9CYAN|nr:hypothetical protein NIES806_15350 [Dolichospermum compactum NIES-806]